MNLEMRFEKVPREKIFPAKYNPRKELKKDDPEYQRLVTAIRTHGMVDPLVWNEFNGVLVGGHQRYNVLKNEFHVEEVWCSVVNIPDDLQEKALNIGLNKLGGEWDNEKLRELLADFKNFPEDNDVKESMGFSQLEFEYLSQAPKETNEQEIKTTPKEALKRYQENTIKQITLYFDEESYGGIVEKLRKLRQKFGFEDNTSVFLKLLEEYENANAAQATA